MIQRNWLPIIAFGKVWNTREAFQTEFQKKIKLALVELAMERKIRERECRKVDEREKCRQFRVSVAQYMEKCFTFLYVAMRIIQICTGLSFSFYRVQ